MFFSWKDRFLGRVGGSFAQACCFMRGCGKGFHNPSFLPKQRQVFGALN